MSEKNMLPLILVTNDDGVSAKGISELTEAVKGLGRVVVVAPDSARSGQSGAITTNKGMELVKIREEESLEVYASNGTPVDCVKLAMNTLLDQKPDLIVSGINHGSNAAVSVLYSGTMGAVLEGCVNGIPSVGFSICSFDADADFSVSGDYVRNIVREVLANGLESGVCLNVNIPHISDLKGVKVCRQAAGYWTKEYELRTDESGKEAYWLTGYFHNEEPDACDTDEWALKEGYISIVPCLIDMTAHNYIDKLGSFSKIDNN